MSIQLNRTWSCAMLFLFMIAVSSNLTAQEPTAAGTYNEGLALLKAKSYDEGLVKMEKALELATAGGDEKIIGLAKKNGAVAAYNAAGAKRKAKSFDEAMALYTKAAELNPDYSSTYDGIARTQEAQGKKTEAIGNYLKAASMATTEGKPKRATSRYKKVRTMVGKMYVAKDYDGAIAAGNSFIAVNDADADVHYYVSKALSAKGDNKSAVSHITKAVMLAGDAAPDKYHYAQGEQLEKLGKKADAIVSYKKITDAKYKAQAVYRIGELSK